MKPTIAASGLLALVLLPAQVRAQEAPWALKFTHSNLEVHSITYRDRSARSFYFFTFEIKNTTQQEAPLALHIRAEVTADRKTRKHVAVPAPDAEEAIRRLSRTPDLLNVQQINEKKTLAAGERLKGIAVLGTFSREWDTAKVLVSGLEPFTRHMRVRKYGSAGFTLFHRAYTGHNAKVRAKAGKDATFTEASAVVKHDIVWTMHFHREGDEFAPQLDPIILDTEGWDVIGAEIIHEKKVPFGD